MDKPTKSLKNEPNTMPTTAAEATRKACSVVAPVLASSPTRAPTKGPIRIPKGPKMTTPAIVPMTAPATPNPEALWPRAARAGAKISNTTVSTTSTANTAKAETEIKSNWVYQAKINRPTSDTGSPGRKGKIDPATPAKINKAESKEIKA